MLNTKWGNRRMVKGDNFALIEENLNVFRMTDSWISRGREFKWLDKKRIKWEIDK